MGVTLSPVGHLVMSGDVVFVTAGGRVGTRAAAKHRTILSTVRTMQNYLFPSVSSVLAFLATQFA